MAEPAPTPIGKRILIGLLAALATGAVVGIVLAFLGFVIAANMKGRSGEGVGYATIVLAPGGGVIASIAAFVAALFPFGKRPWLRFAIIVAVSHLTGAAMLIAISR